MVSGARNVVLEHVVPKMKAQGLKVHQLAVERGFHSPQTDSVASQLGAELAGLARQAPQCAVFSTVWPGTAPDALDFDAGYWAQHTRGTVHFGPAMEQLLRSASGRSVVVMELGPDAVLVNMARKLPAATAAGLAFVPSLCRQEADAVSLVRAAASVWLAGVPAPGLLSLVTGGCGDAARALPELPTTPFVRVAHWLSPSKSPSGSLPDLSLAAAVSLIPEESSDRASADVASTDTGLCLEQLQQLVQERFGLASLPQLDDNLWDLGLDSALFTEVLGVLRQQHGVQLPQRAMLACDTMRKLWHQVQLAEQQPQVLAGASPLPPSNVEEARSIAADCQLPDWVRKTVPLTDGAPQQSGHAAVLVTGATGFFGRWLLAALMQRLPPSTHVICLVRCSDGEAVARERLASVMATDPGLPALGDRVEVLVGDAAQPRLGLDDTAYEQLARRLVAVYHVAANVNLLMPYAAVRAANVGAVHHVLALALAAGRVPVHHMSTIGVFYDLPAGMLITEDTAAPAACPVQLQAFGAGYRASKWVAERLVAQARAELGLPATVYRLGVLTGSCDHGVCNRSSAVLHFLRTCIRLQAVPATRNDVAVDMTPVDFAAQAVATLSRMPGAAPSYFIVDRRPLSLPALVQLLRDELGHPLQETPADEWAARVCTTTKASLATVLANNYLASRPRYGTACLERDLQAHGLVCPAITAALLRRYLAWARDHVPSAADRCA